MTDDTQQIGKRPLAESQVGGVSIRGWIVVMVMGTLCLRELVTVWFAMRGMMIAKVEEPFYSVIMVLVGYYFGQKTQQTQTK